MCKGDKFVRGPMAPHTKPTAPKPEYPQIQKTNATISKPTIPTTGAIVPATGTGRAAVPPDEDLVSRVRSTMCMIMQENATERDYAATLSALAILFMNNQQARLGANPAAVHGFVSAAIVAARRASSQ